MGGVVKTVSKPFKKIGKAISKGVSSAFKAAKNVWNGVETVGKNLLGNNQQEAPKVDIQAPAQAAPLPEQTTEEMSRPENVGRKKRARNSLRIDLNTAGAPAGNGVNVPIG